MSKPADFSKLRLRSFARSRNPISPQGDYFGEIALLNDVPRQATVKAVGDVSVISLDKASFYRLYVPFVIPSVSDLAPLSVCDSNSTDAGRSWTFSSEM
jgi:hypothetical protein